MSGRISPSFRRRRLGRRLQQLRERSGLSLDEAAPRLEKTRSSLHRIEKGETRADVHLIKSMMDLYDHFDPELLALARDAAKQGWWRQFGPDGQGYVGAETEAAAVLEFGGLNTPGLLQTEDYARAILSVGPRKTEERLHNDVTVRMIRQQRLTDREHSLRLTAIVDEAALHREVGSREVMRSQLRHLVEAAELPTVTLQVLPLRSGAHDSMTGGFIVLTFPDEEEADLLYISHVAGSLHVENPEQLHTAKLTFNRLRSQALPPSDSAALILRLAEERFGSS